MVSRRSVRIKSTSVLKKLKKRIGSKSKSSVGVQDVNLKRAAANSQIDTARECSRTGRTSTSENNQKETRSSEILTKKSKNIADHEDSRIKSCTVLAVKLKYPYVARTTSVKLNSKSSNKNNNSPKALPRTTPKPPDTDFDEAGASRKSSRMRKPTSKELRSVLISTDTKLELRKHNDEVSPQKLRNKSIKPQITNEASIPEQKAQVSKVSLSGKKVKEDVECVRCGLTPSQFFGRDAKRNTVCCFCSLVKPPPELKALLQLLKLDCCLKFLNQNNQNNLETKIAPSRKRRMSGHTSQADHENATSSSNSELKTLRERSTVRAEKEQYQNSPEEQKQNASQFNKPIRQQKGNSNASLNKLSNSTKSSNSAAGNAKINTRVTGKMFPRIKPPTKSSRQNLSTIADIHRNLKRKISPQTTQNPTKRRKLAGKVEAQKKTDREHICSSCNSTFAMQWKLKLHELTHTDKSYPNVVLRHAEVEDPSDCINIAEGSEVIDCDPNNESATDKDSLSAKASDHAIHQISTTTEELQEDKTALEEVTSNEGGDNFEHSQAFKQGNEVKSALENNEETANKDGSNDIQHLEIREAKTCDAPANRENTEVNEKSNGSHLQTNSDTASGKDNVEFNEESDIAARCAQNTAFNSCTNLSNKAKEDKNEKSDLNISSDINCLSTQEQLKDCEQNELNHPSENASNKSEEPRENQRVIENSKPLVSISDKHNILDQSEVQNTLKGLNEVREENEKNEESVKVIEELEICELSKTNEDKLASEEKEKRSNEIADIAGKKMKMHEDDGGEISKIDENHSKENLSLKNSCDHCEVRDDESLVTEKDSNSEDTAPECSSEIEKIKIKLKDNHDQCMGDVSENTENQINGTLTDGDDGSKSVFESENSNHPKTVINHTADNISQHPVDENMTELYNQMNIMFEGESSENKAAKTEIEKKSPDHNGNCDNSSESNDQRKLTENAITSKE